MSIALLDVFIWLVYTEHARTMVDAHYHHGACWGIDCCLFLYGIRLSEFALLRQLLYVGFLPDLVFTVCFPVHCPFVLCACSPVTLNLANDE